MKCSKIKLTDEPPCHRCIYLWVRIKEKAMSELIFKLKIKYIKILWFFGLLHSSAIEYIEKEVYWTWRWSRRAKLFTRRISPYIALVRSREVSHE
jgi:hypothetical protein